eukprot:2699490-Rhodomonas_salina.1
MPLKKEEEPLFQPPGPPKTGGRPSFGASEPPQIGHVTRHVTSHVGSAPPGMLSASADGGLLAARACSRR